MTQDINKNATSNENTSTAPQAPQKSIRKQDPTARWSERVREFSAKKRRPINYRKHKDNLDYDEDSVKTDLQQIIETTQSCIIKRPLTSMVIAITAGATITALLSAAMGSKKTRD